MRERERRPGRQAQRGKRQGERNRAETNENEGIDQSDPRKRAVEEKSALRRTWNATEEQVAMTHRKRYGERSGKRGTAINEASHEERGGIRQERREK